MFQYIWASSLFCKFKFGVCTLRLEPAENLISDTMWGRYTRRIQKFVNRIHSICSLNKFAKSPQRARFAWNKCFVTRVIFEFANLNQQRFAMELLPLNNIAALGHYLLSISGFFHLFEVKERFTNDSWNQTFHTDRQEKLLSLQRLSHTIQRDGNFLRSVLVFQSKVFTNPFFLTLSNINFQPCSSNSNALILSLNIKVYESVIREAKKLKNERDILVVCIKDGGVELWLWLSVLLS